MNSKEKVMTGTSIYPCVLFQPLSNFNFMERLEVLILKKQSHLDYPKFYVVNSKEKKYEKWNFAIWRLNWYESSLQPLCQSFETVLVSPCFFTNTTSLELKSLLSLFFFLQNWVSQIGSAAYLQEQLIHWLLRYVSPQRSFRGKRSKRFWFTKIQEVFGLWNLIKTW